MSDFIYAGTVQAASKCLSLWNGSSNNAPPANWDAVGFDDSAWPASANPTNGNVRVNAKYPNQGIEAVAPWSVPPANHASFLVRCHFTAPANPPYQYYMHDWLMFAANNVAGNSGWGFNGVGSTFRDQVATNASKFNYGADNLLTIWIDMSPTQTTWTAIGSPTEGWFAFRTVFFTQDSGNVASSWGTITPGINDKGVLGTGDTITHLTPTAIDTSGMSADDAASIVKIASNGKTTLFLTATGNVYSCGDNSQGMLGNNTTDTSVHATPTLITTGLLALGQTTAYVVDISIGGDCAIVVTRYGSVRMWGPNAHGSFGRGNTTPRVSPGEMLNYVGNNLPGAPGVTFLVDSCWIAAGSDFSAVVDGVLGDPFIVTAGGNAYGQLGQGTSGADVLSRGSVNPTGAAESTIFGSPTELWRISAGDRQLLVDWRDAGPAWHLVGCGRAALGSLSNSAYSNGTGTDKIVTHFHELEFGFSEHFSIAQAAAVTFVNFTGAGAVGYGDGVPHGGIPDNSGTQVYGQDAAHNRSSPFNTYDAFGNPVALLTLIRLAYTSGGSQNSWAVGDSRAAFAGVGTDGLLYTWGWGGAGQMGSGADPTNNLHAVSINGLTDVIAATVAQAVVFVIARPVPVSAPPGNRAWPQWV